MEANRIRYIVTSYLRCRLQKIEKYVYHLVSDEKQRKEDGLEMKLSPEETRFANEYETHLNEYFQAVALQQMPSNSTRKLETEKLATKPNLEHYVFLRMQRKVNDVMVPNLADDTREIEVDLELDSQHIMPYKIASSLIRDGSGYLM